MKLLYKMKLLSRRRRLGALLTSCGAREGVIKYFAARVEALVSPGKGYSDYQEAQVVLGDLERLFPDAQAVKELRERVAARHSAALQEWTARREAALRKRAARCNAAWQERAAKALQPDKALQPAQPLQPDKESQPSREPSVVSALKDRRAPVPVRSIRVVKPKPEGVSPVDHAVAFASAKGHGATLLAPPIYDEVWDADLHQGFDALAGEPAPADAYIGTRFWRKSGFGVRMGAWWRSLAPGGGK